MRSEPMSQFNRQYIRLSTDGFVVFVIASGSLTPMDVNPYVPTENSNSLANERRTRHSWPVWLCAGWVVFLMLLLPAIPRSQSQPAGTFLTMKLSTSMISLVAASVLLWRPRRRWLLLNIPIVILLSAVQWTAWTTFP